jgi:hypothetical protein
MAKQILSILLIGAVLSAGCSSTSHSESRLVGKWQSEMDQGNGGHKTFKSIETQFEFFTGGTVVKNQKLLGKWEQFGTGSYTFIDSNHLKVDLGWAEGTTVYEIEWTDRDHLSLRAGDRTTQLVRVSGR